MWVCRAKHRHGTHQMGLGAGAQRELNQDGFTGLYCQTTPCVGKTLHLFATDPAGQWLCALNEDSDTIELFSRDMQEGLLLATGRVWSARSHMRMLFSSP